MQIVKMRIYLTLNLLVVIGSCSTLNNSPRVVCYFDSHSLSKQQGGAEFPIGDIDTTLCTHLVYKHAKLNFTTLNVESASPLEDIERKGYEQVVNLTDRNPRVKVMIALRIGNLRAVAAYNETQISALITNIGDFLSLHKFDGIDLDFEQDSQIYEFVNLVETIGKITQHQNESLLLSLVLQNSDVDYINESDVSRLSKVLDFLNLKTYEFVYPTNRRDQLADHHAPLFNRSWDAKNPNNNVDAVVSKWISKGFPRDKIVVDIPLFGLGWILSSNEINPPAPANGPSAQRDTQTISRKGYSAYYEICWDVQSHGWQVFQDHQLKMGPYAVSPSTNKRTWIGYDDPAMAIVKSKYILSKKLGGAAIANIEYDDFRNKCGAGYNPMMTAIYKTLILDPKTFVSITFPPEYSYSDNKLEQTSDSDNSLTVNKICFSTVIAFATPLVVLALLLVILICLLAKIFCCKKATRLNNSEIPLSKY